MNRHPDSTGIAALDELGSRFDAVAARPARSRRPVRWPAVILCGLALAAAPAVATVVDGADRVEDQLPRVAAAIDRDDPGATARALAQAGYRVRWVLVTDAPGTGGPTSSRPVGFPPPRTEILAVLNSRGGNSVSPGMRTLLIELAPVGSAILETHR